MRQFALGFFVNLDEREVPDSSCRGCLPEVTSIITFQNSINILCFKSEDFSKSLWSKGIRGSKRDWLG